MALETPQARTPKKVQCREETAGEGGERKNSPGRQSLTKESEAIVARKGPIHAKVG